MYKEKEINSNFDTLLVQLSSNARAEKTVQTFLKLGSYQWESKQQADLSTGGDVRNFTFHMNSLPAVKG